MIDESKLSEYGRRLLEEGKLFMKRLDYEKIDDFNQKGVVKVGDYFFKSTIGNPDKRSAMSGAKTTGLQKI